MRTQLVVKLTPPRFARPVGKPDSLSMEKIYGPGPWQSTSPVPASTLLKQKGPLGASRKYDATIEVILRTPLIKTSGNNDHPFPLEIATCLGGKIENADIADVLNLTDKLLCTLNQETKRHRALCREGVFSITSRNLRFHYRSVGKGFYLRSGGTLLSYCQRNYLGKIVIKIRLRSY